MVAVLLAPAVRDVIDLVVVMAISSVSPYRLFADNAKAIVNAPTSIVP